MPQFSLCSACPASRALRGRPPLRGRPFSRPLTNEDPMHGPDVVHSTSARINPQTARGLWPRADFLIFASRRNGRFPAEGLRQESGRLQTLDIPWQSSAMVNTDALFRIGDAAEDEGNFTLARQSFERGSALGDTTCLCRLARMFDLGLGVGTDKLMAMRLYQRAWPPIEGEGLRLCDRTGPSDWVRAPVLGLAPRNRLRPVTYGGPDCGQAPSRLRTTTWIWARASRRV
jgi:hypothetical protein